ncbi:hypothetical protein KIPB_001730 [Kipferlia bialata]|uniref:Kelch-type beta propeller n=1 Tax=Kipferlia bialata TaxID=797122 RepID=A0A391P0F5_9EUKA|nr:hypothetical protein KIPB_001730 [Kipferlia bialata]|eukprot:g1730.t1
MWDTTALQLAPHQFLKKCVSVATNCLLCELTTHDFNETNTEKGRHIEFVFLTRADGDSPLHIVRDPMLRPPPTHSTLFGYTLTNVDGCVYVFGGTHDHTLHTSDLHILHLDTLEWETLRDPSVRERDTSFTERHTPRAPDANRSLLYRVKRKLGLIRPDGDSVSPSTNYIPIIDCGSDTPGVGVVWPSPRRQHLVAPGHHSLSLLGAMNHTLPKWHPEYSPTVKGDYTFDTEDRVWARLDRSTSGRDDALYQVVSVPDGPLFLFNRSGVSTYAGDCCQQAPFTLGRDISAEVFGRHLVCLASKCHRIYALDTVSGEWHDWGVLPIERMQFTTPALYKLDDTTAIVVYPVKERREESSYVTTSIALLEIPPGLI